jgi:glycosyltransferase involved in cell wall biosynthesis
MTTIAVFSHGHPFYSKGGGEIVAFNSFRAMRGSNLDAHLYCAINQDLKPDFNLFAPGEHLLEFGPHEYLFPARKLDFFLCAHNDRAFFPALIRKLSEQKIDVFHFHHFWSVGTDLIIQLMECFPAARFILTLHELLAICLRDGQMVRTKTNELCVRPSDIECHMCFPQFDKDQFRARRLFLSEFLGRFDVLISPSAFVARRINEWGVNKKIHVMENGYSPPAAPPQIDTEDEVITKRFAFFGQPTPFKGLDIFVSAASQVDRGDITFAVYGCDRRKFVEQFGPQWDGVIDSMAGRLQFLGPYDPQSVFQLMQNNGWIVISSIWWENSPLVIQEAFLAGRPPIVANIGGMSEKVENGVNGLHFTARNSAALAGVMRSAAGNVDLWHNLRFGINPPPTMEEMTGALANLYASVNKPCQLERSPGKSIRDTPHDHGSFV